MIEEIWKDIKGYEGLYQVSTLGRIRSLDVVRYFYPMERKPYTQLRKGRILKPYYRKDGFTDVTLYKDGVANIRLIHILVATTFLENPMGRKMVWFKDGDKTNTKLDNLKWSKYD